MSKVIVDKELIEQFLTRGVEQVYPTTEELRKKLMSGERIIAYQGYDPTGKFLHVGHAMGIRSMRILQKLGHEVIFLVGDFTARVGDPDKDSARTLLTTEEIKANMAGWKEQAAQMIDFGGDNPVQFLSNFDWLSKLKLEDLIELMSKMTVQQMMERDMFTRRYKNGDPIGLQEFIYPLMQGYDGVAMNVDLEIGGADQTFNMLVGRSLNKAYLNKDKFVRTNKMMDAPDCRTMSKTKGNGINLGDSAEDMYGKGMSYPDHLISMGLELLTDVPMSKIKEIEAEIKNGANPMEFKKMMAWEIVRVIKGEEAANIGAAHFQKTVQGKALPDDIELKAIGVEKMNIVDLLLQLEMVTSKGEARRLMAQNGIKLDGQAITDVEMELELNETEQVLQRGKRQFVKVVR